MFLFLFMHVEESQAQKKVRPYVTGDFTYKDTVCINTPVTITNLSQGATNYFWKFCPGTPLSFPRSVTTGDIPNKLKDPFAVSLQQDGSRYYAFITNSGDGTISRATWETSLVNSPTIVKLNLPGVFTNDIAGIRIKYDNGVWYGFVTTGSSLIRLDFGSSLGNPLPVINTVITSPLMNNATGLDIINDGTGWIGFCTTFPGNTIVRFVWGNTLSSVPAISLLGNIGGLTRPIQPAIVQDQSGWYMYIANTTTLTELIFGNSLMNTPAGFNFGQMDWITDTRGVSSLSLCGHPYILVSNHDGLENQLFQIYFPGGLSGPKSWIPMGNIGWTVFQPLALSETLNIGDTTYCIVVNSAPSLTVLYFPACDKATIPVSTQFDPSPVYFPLPGVYTIKLTVDRGMLSEQQVCKMIEINAPSINLGRDTALCEGGSVTLDAGGGFISYLWSTGDTTQKITVSTSGNYSVTGTNRLGCLAKDTLLFTVNPVPRVTVDTAICHGLSYLASGKLQSVSGTYIDSLMTKKKCDSIVTTHLTVKPEIDLKIFNDTCVKRGTYVKLVARVAGATEYTWQDGSHDSTLTTSSAGQFWVRVLVNSCQKTDSTLIGWCDVPLYFYVPNAFTPNGDGLNDYLRPISIEVTEFYMIIFDRWGKQIFETRDKQKGWDGTCKGSLCDPGVYTYKIVYRTTQSPESYQTISGSVTLLR